MKDHIRINAFGGNFGTGPRVLELYANKSEKSLAFPSDSALNISENFVGDLEHKSPYIGGNIKDKKDSPVASKAAHL